MTKILTTLILAAFAFSAQAASHAGAAPMKAASAPTHAASGAKKAAHTASGAAAMPKKEEAKK